MNGDRFARVPMGVVVSELDDPCVRLYAWLALEVGGTGWERTVTAGAKALRWERHTAYRHARHLAEAGRIELLSMGTGSSSRMRLTPQPGSETTTPNGGERNAMEDGPAKTKVTTEDFMALRI